MADQLFKIEAPITALRTDAKFEMLLGRKCSISYSYESIEDESVILERLLFDGVEGYKCTYYTACSIEMISAYGRVLNLGRSKWLQEITSNLLDARGSIDGLKHLQIFFDDGPCYEFICRSFHTSTENIQINDFDPN